jgi:hypothetical protein
MEWYGGGTSWQVQNLSILEQLLAQPQITNLLDADVIINGQHCGSSCALSEYHEHRLLAD